MSRRQELVSPEGLRLDGRRVNELRSIGAAMGVVSGRQGEGSASFESGNTRVLATVFGPRETGSGDGQGMAMGSMLPISDASSQERGTIRVRIHAASFSSSGGERRKGTQRDRRLLEWARHLEEAFAAVVTTTTFPRSQLDIFVEISNADGGVLAAVFNAITLALLDAGIPMSDYIVAETVCYVQGQGLLDPNRMEESSACPVLIAALLPRTHTLVFVHSEQRLASDKLSLMLDLAGRGVARVFHQLDTEVVRPHLLSLLERRTRSIVG